MINKKEVKQGIDPQIQHIVTMNSLRNEIYENRKKMIEEAKKAIHDQYEAIKPKMSDSKGGFTQEWKDWKKNRQEEIEALTNHIITATQLQPIEQ